MVKSEIIKELKSYGIKPNPKAPRLVLLGLLGQVQDEYEAGYLTSEVLFFDDVYYRTGMNNVKKRNS